MTHRPFASEVYEQIPRSGRNNSCNDSCHIPIQNLKLADIVTAYMWMREATASPIQRKYISY